MLTLPGCPTDPRATKRLFLVCLGFDEDTDLLHGLYKELKARCGLGWGFNIEGIKEPYISYIRARTQAFRKRETQKSLLRDEQLMWLLERRSLKTCCKE